MRNNTAVDMARLIEKSRAAGGSVESPAVTWSDQQQRNAIAAKAHDAVRYAVRVGVLIPTPCQCGRPSRARHDDYSTPLAVRWQCGRCYSLGRVAPVAEIQAGWKTLSKRKK